MSQKKVFLHQKFRPGQIYLKKKSINNKKKKLSEFLSKKHTFVREKQFLSEKQTFLTNQSFCKRKRLLSWKQVERNLTYKYMVLFPPIESYLETLKYFFFCKFIQHRFTYFHGIFQMG